MTLANASECLNRAMNALTDGNEAIALAALSGARLNLEMEELASPASKPLVSLVMTYLYQARLHLSAGLPDRALENVQTAVQLLDEHLIPGVKEDVERLLWADHEAALEASSCYEDGTSVPSSAQFTEPYQRFEAEAERLERLWEARHSK
jgi:hypothetical protein